MNWVLIVGLLLVLWVWIEQLPVSVVVVDVYVYWAVEDQTDGNPMQPADPTVTYEGIDPAEEHHCALSQDLLWFEGGPARFGDRVVFLRPSIMGLWRVSDAMGEHASRSADLLVPVGTLGRWRKVPMLILRRVPLRQRIRAPRTAWLSGA